MGNVYMVDAETGQQYCKFDDGYEEWRNVTGQRHRLDGPAVVKADGRQEWWVNGERHRDDGPAVIKADGTQEWWQKGRLHRTDGPAIIHPGGDMEWWLNSERHRDDGPAIIWTDGSEFWYREDNLHRLDGPAVINADRSCQWRVKERKMSSQVYNKAVISLAGELCDVTSEELKSLPFSQIESLVYSFNGWVKESQ